MSQGGKPGLIDTVKEIAGEARRIVEELKPKAAEGAELTQTELATIRKLVQRSEDAMSEANRLAKERRQQEIAELEELIESIESGLSTPGLSRSARDDLKNLKRRRRAQLLNLQTREALDFGGILTAPQVEEITAVLKRAKQDVAKKKKAAAFVATLLKVADIGVGIVRKAGAAI